MTVDSEDTAIVQGPLPPSERPDRDENLTFTLPSGRVLGYARYGVAESVHPTTFYFHGYPTCRIEAALFSKELFEAGLRLISVDRPGFGLSQTHEGRSTLDHAEDVRALADHLGLDRFAVIGVSGGGPYALACAKLLPPERLIAVGVAAGFATYEFAMSSEAWKGLWWVNKLGLIAPVRFTRPYCWLYSKVVPYLLKSAEATKYEKVIGSSSFRKQPIADQEATLKSGKEGYDDSVRGVRESLRQKDWAKAHIQEPVLLSKPWAFKLQDVEFDRIKLWYGSLDKNVPLVVGRMVADALPRAEFNVIEGGTHASVIMDTARLVKELVVT